MIFVQLVLKKKARCASRRKKYKPLMPAYWNGSILNEKPIPTRNLNTASLNIWMKPPMNIYAATANGGRRGYAPILMSKQ